MPSAPTTLDTPELPGAPHISPEESNSLNLPGAPKFLPDDDLSSINKLSSIHVYQPGSEEEKKVESEKKTESEKKPEKQEKQEKQTTPKHQHQPLSQENINTMITKEEQINKIQKHCKFAMSALNYEDLNTAETQLSEGLELIKLIKNTK